MASLNLFVSPAAVIISSSSRSRAGRVYATTAAKSSGASEEKGLLDWILGSLAKEDQMLETDPILKKVEEKNSGSGSGSGSGGGRKNTVVVPPKKKSGGGGGGFGGLFVKNE